MAETAETTDGGRSAADSVIVIEPEDIVTPDQAPQDAESGLGRHAGGTSDDAGWDNSVHWHRAVPPTEADLDQDADQDLESSADLSPEPEADLTLVPDALTLVPDAEPRSVPEAVWRPVPDAEPSPVPAVPAVPSVQAELPGSQERWREIQSAFVDDPGASVAEAAALAEQEFATWTRQLTERQETMRGGWQADQDPSTEDMRNALRAYREFCRGLAAAADALA
jgi:hypothetical protein